MGGQAKKAGSDEDEFDPSEVDLVNSDGDDDSEDDVPLSGRKRRRPGGVNAPAGDKKKQKPDNDKGKGEVRVCSTSVEMS